jgi:hypothetical protein
MIDGLVKGRDLYIYNRTPMFKNLWHLTFSFYFLKFSYKTLSFHIAGDKNISWVVLIFDYISRKRLVVCLLGLQQFELLYVYLLDFIWHNLFISSNIVIFSQPTWGKNWSYYWGYTKKFPNLCRIQFAWNLYYDSKGKVRRVVQWICSDCRGRRCFCPLLGDAWIGGLIEEAIAPVLIKLIRPAVRSRRTISDGLVANSWAQDISRDLSVDAVVQYLRLWTQVSSVLTTGISPGVADSFTWGHFSSRSAYNMLFQGTTARSSCGTPSRRWNLRCMLSLPCAGDVGRLIDGCGEVCPLILSAHSMILHGLWDCWQLLKMCLGFISRVLS